MNLFFELGGKEEKERRRETLEKKGGSIKKTQPLFFASEKGKDLSLISSRDKKKKGER